MGSLFNKYKNQPVIVVGSGPSLKENVKDLVDTKGIPIISCLHNYHFLEDNGVKVDYYATLDAGEVVIEEVSEGGSKTPEDYFASSKDKTLLAFIGTSPRLIQKWQGKVIWFNAPIPAPDIEKEFSEVEPFGIYVSSGGNVLGACFYIAKAICGSDPIIFVGADFSFSTNNKFHAWKSKYDATLGECQRMTNVFGIPVWTWASYVSFKCWFESRFLKVPGNYINATEGGILGAYPGGNIAQIKQMALSEVVSQYSINEPLRAQCENAELCDKIILF